MPTDNKQKLVAEAEQFFKDYDPDDGFDTFDVMAAFAERHANDVLAAERARVTKEILALQTPGPTESPAAASWNRALFQARKIVEQNNE